MPKHRPSFIERLAETLHLIPDLHGADEDSLPPIMEPGKLTDYPPPERWDDWTEYEATSGQRREKKNYMIVPTTCFNCEAGCGLLSYVDKETMRVRKFEGNPYHPGSRGRNCAKGPATINQINDQDRILYPMRRKGKRGDGDWERVSWDEVLDDIAGKIRAALIEDRRNEVVYHVGRPGHEGFIDRVLQAWGVDGHNSHTNICSAGAGNLGGWAVARCLHFLSVLTGSVGTVGGTSPSAWNKFKPAGFSSPPAQKFWNELHFPLEYPLSHYEMSFLLPHFLKEGRAKLTVYFTRVFNPVWTYPDGFTWIESLSDESRVGLHVALTPTWNETAYFADYVLPMGHASERHDLTSYETHSGMWVSFRQPVLREAARRQGRETEFTYETNPGEVWEEDEFWFELSWRIDPDGSLGIRKHFESPYRPGEKITIDEYYQYIFEKTKGLPERAAEEGMTPLDYMRKYGAFEVEQAVYEKHMDLAPESQVADADIDTERGDVRQNGKVVAAIVDGKARVGFNTPSKRQELFSKTTKDWGWPEYAFPTYVKSHIHTDELAENEMVLVPTFRLPTLIHTRSGQAKWLAEISNRNPLWMHTSDGERLGIKTGDLVRISTEIGYFVNRAWVTEGMRPQVVACSHHIGRWRRAQDAKSNRWSTNQVIVKEEEPGKWKMWVNEGIGPYKSDDPDTSRIFWTDGGVHQNITFPVHPDPVSGMHCWHQKVVVEPAKEGDEHGDVYVDTDKSFEVYKQWLAMARPAPGPEGLRRPLWLARPLRPADEMFYVKNGVGGGDRNRTDE
jgi:anaerobic selenocysteine-containing dehydrogenase